MSMLPWATSLPWNMLQTGAKANNLDLNFVAALVMQETGGDSWKSRYEEKFRYLFKTQEFAISRGISDATETVHQKTSWGYMQIMGAVAREIGFRGDLPELGRPALGLKWGCIKLRSVMDRYGKGGLGDVAAAWNAGSPQKLGDGTYVNQRYVASVMRYYNDLVR